jgi:hypothetical protein
VLSVAANELEQAREQRFVTELRLGLDGIALAVVEAPGDGFVAASMSDQILALRPLLEREGAVAAVWLEEGGPGEVILLHLIALDTGRALARIVEVEQKPDAESELALAAAALLGEAYLFTPEREPAIEKAVAAVEEAIVPAVAADEAEEPAPPAPAPRDDTRLGVGVIGSLGSGLHGHSGPSLRGGVGAAVELVVFDGLELRLGAGAEIGPREDSASLSLLVLGVRSELTVAFLWWRDRIAAGLAASFGVLWWRRQVALGDGPQYEFDGWNLRPGLGPELRFALHPVLDLLIGADVGVWARTETDRRQSDEGVGYATPRVDWRAVVGVVFRIH